MVKKLIVGNWKMNPQSASVAKDISEKIFRGAKKFRNITVVIVPPAPFISSLKGVLGAQDFFYEKEGAYTGMMSAEMLKSLGVKYVIVGHSERRHAGDTDEIVNKKLKRALDVFLIPILCVGEETRDHHSQYLHFVRGQIVYALKNVSKNLVGKIVIAYEPVWAIGKNAKGVLDGEEALHMNIFIRKVVADIAGEKTAKKIKVLYGGSVDGKNSTQFMSLGKMDGLLVWRESLVPKNFLKIIEHGSRS